MRYPEKIPHKKAANSSISCVKYSHCTYSKVKKALFNNKLSGAFTASTGYFLRA